MVGWLVGWLDGWSDGWTVDCNGGALRFIESGQSVKRAYARVEWYIPLAVGRNLPTCVPLLVPLLPPLIIDSPFREDSKRNLI